MSNLSRVVQKIFGGALAAPSNIARFGSLKDGSPAYSLDPALIQTDAWLQAWGGALINAPGGLASPALQDMNAVFYVLSRQLAYVFQKGVPEWSADETYYIGSWARNSAGVMYISKTDGNLNNALTDTNNWQTLASTLVGTQNGVAKAWVCFNGTGGLGAQTIYSASNVASVTKTGTGSYTINFNTALPNNSYAFSGSAGTPNGAAFVSGDDNIIAGGFNGRTGLRTTSQLAIVCVRPEASSLEDSRCISVLVFGTSDTVGNSVNFATADPRFVGAGGGGGDVMLAH